MERALKRETTMGERMDGRGARSHLCIPLSTNLIPGTEQSSLLPQQQ